MSGWTLPQIQISKSWRFEPIDPLTKTQKILLLFKTPQFSRSMSQRLTEAPVQIPGDKVWFTFLKRPKLILSFRSDSDAKKIHIFIKNATFGSEYFLCQDLWEIWVTIFSASEVAAVSRNPTALNAISLSETEIEKVMSYDSDASGDAGWCNKNSINTRLTSLTPRKSMGRAIATLIKLKTGWSLDWMGHQEIVSRGLLTNCWQLSNAQDYK